MKSPGGAETIRRAAGSVESGKPIAVRPAKSGAGRLLHKQNVLSSTGQNGENQTGALRGGQGSSSCSLRKISALMS